MRSGTKLKHILKDYTLDISIQHNIFKLVAFRKEYIVDEDTIGTIFTGQTWSSVINQAYRKLVK